MNIFSTRFKKTLLSTAIVSLALPAFSHAEENDSFADAVTGGKFYLDARYRYEFVDQDGIDNNANASTLRTKLGYKTGEFQGFSGVLEFENSTEVGSGEFNNTVNGKGDYPVVADPENTEVNQAYLTYSGLEGFSLSAGRQAVNLDNQRFVGTVGFRQNDQTFDAVSLVNSSVEDLTLLYAYVWNVNRIFGEDHPFGDLNTKTHIFNASYKGFKAGTLTAYGLMIDLNDMAVWGLSSKTFGIRFAGATEVGNNDMKILYELEYANQTDHGDNPGNFSVNYFHGAAGVNVQGITAKVGYELLGSDDGAASFKTPLATLHKFNGWADKFLGTPATGLRDFYVNLGYVAKGTDSFLDGTKFVAFYHKFSADFGGADYGTEWDFLISKKIMKHYSVGLKYARYNADTYATDTSKLWLTVGAKF